MPINDHRLHRLSLLGAALVATTLGIAFVIGFQAVRAASLHRRAAEASLKHHAGIAAWRFAREARSWLGFGMAQAGDQLRAELGRHATLPGPDVLQRVLAEKECDCMSAGFARTFVRISASSEPTVLVVGDSLSAASQGSLAGVAARMMADTVRRQEQELWRMLPPGEPGLTRADDVMLLWHIPAALPGGPRAVYGMVVEVAQIVRPLTGAVETAQLFPPTLVPPRRADSLVRIEALGPTGTSVFASGPSRDAYTGNDTVGVRYGDLVVSAALAPETAELLLDDPLPPSRAPLIFGLLGGAAVVGAGALVVLRREQKLTLLREDFVSGVSHELRTPLTQIRMLSELLQSDGFKTEEERARAHGIIHREAMRLTSLVDNVLEFSRRRRAPSTTLPTSVRLSEVVREMQESFAPLLAAERNALEVDVDDDLEVPGDRDTVTRVLRNLVENAVKYGPRGQVIRLTARRAPAAMVRLTVDDEGAGIPERERERIFEPYYRLERDRNAPAGGTGIGLAVVADLLRTVGGRVFVGRAPGGGARFTVEFPGSNGTTAHG